MHGESRASSSRFRPRPRLEHAPLPVSQDEDVEMDEPDRDILEEDDIEDDEYEESSGDNKGDSEENSLPLGHEDYPSSHSSDSSSSDADDDDNDGGDDEDDDDNDDDDVDMHDYDDDVDSQSEDERFQRQGGKATAAEKAQKLMADFHRLPAEMQTISQLDAVKLNNTTKSAKRWIKKHRSWSPSQETLEGWLRSAEQAMEDGIWTEEHEEDFQQGLQEDPYLDYIRTSFQVPPGNKGYIPMWKKICRLRECFPTSIICQSNMLEYGASDPITLSDGSQAPNPVWNRGFCDRMVRLALGGPWKGNIFLLAMFIRYAVACRMNDRRSIPMEHRSTDMFLSSMERVLGEQRDGTQSIPRIHKAVRRQIRRTGVYLPWFSMLMRNIEKLAYKKETVPFFDEDEIERRPYRVLTEDLHSVELAVHHCKDMGQSMFSSVGDKAKIASHERGYDYPKNSADLQHLNELHYVAEKRLELKKQLAPVPQSSSSSGQISPRGYPGADATPVEERNQQYRVNAAPVQMQFDSDDIYDSDDYGPAPEPEPSVIPDHSPKQEASDGAEEVVPEARAPDSRTKKNDMPKLDMTLDEIIAANASNSKRSSGEVVRPAPEELPATMSIEGLTEGHKYGRIVTSREELYRAANEIGDLVLAESGSLQYGCLVALPIIKKGVEEPQEADKGATKKTRAEKKKELDDDLDNYFVQSGRRQVVKDEED